MEGLFFESSATVPYHFLNQSELSKTPSRAMRDLPYRDLDVAKGVEHLQLLGVKYYLATSPEAQAQAAQRPELNLLTETSERQVNYPDGTKPRTWQIYEVEGTELVAPLAFEPVVVESGVSSKHGWLDAAVDWYQDAARWDIPLATGGPDEWARISDASKSAPPTAVRPAEVSNIRSDDDGVSFDVDRPGAPVVVRTSYFPNWKADGAEGPWRITPNLMVVVPTSEHVELHYGWTGLDVGAWLLTLLGAIGVGWVARRGRLALPEPPPPSPAEHVDPFVVADAGLPEREPAEVLERATTP
jgi:hypothetical protein